MAEIAEGSQLENKAEVQGDPKRLVRRWNLELKLADKREKDWRKEAKEVLDRYKSKRRAKGSFNILWSNTEVLEPALYNSLPTPDVRRRFKDADPLGKAVAEVLERCQAYMVESTNAHDVFEGGVKDALLVGRGVSWARYVPSFVQRQIEGSEDFQEQLEWEQCEFEKVKWDDFRSGPGFWEEKTWTARRHRLNREQLIEKFGEIGNEIDLDQADDEDVKRADKDVQELFKTATVWEIWDKDSLTCLFVAPSYDKGPLKLESDPLQLKGFFPCPKPLVFIEDPDDGTPVPLYRMYEEQAKELDEVSRRINGLIKAIRANGIRDARIVELERLATADDGELIPAENLTALLSALGGGGLDKIIWTRPIDQYVKVFAELIAQREQIKQTIREITGLSDIIRGASNPNETATAQQIKNQWGSLRIQKPKAKVQAWIRDAVRIMAEIISQRFQIETFQKMTGLQYPTLDEKEQARALIQQSQQAGMQPPDLAQAQETLNKPAWEEIVSILRSDPSREFRIDIETDSTVAETQDKDMTGLKDILSGLVQFWQGVAPAVQLGALPIEAVKEISLAVARRAKLGMAVEDAIDKIQQPQQGDPVEAAKAEAEKMGQVEQIKQQTAIQTAKLQGETQKQIEGIKASASMEAEKFKAQKQVEIEQVKATNDAQNVMQQVGQLLAQHQMLMRQTVDQLAQAGQTVAAQGIMDSGQLVLQQIAPLLMKLERSISAPRKLVRDEMGRPSMSVIDSGETLQ